MVSKTCPKGMIKKKAYTSKRGSKTIKVKGSCIKATSVKGVKRSTLDKKALRKIKSKQEKVAKKYGHVECPPGQIERAGYTRRGYERRGYTRKSGSKVGSANVRPAEARPVCIKKRGRGTGLKIPTVLEKGDLKKFGYADVRNLSSNERHDALSRAVKTVKNPLSIFRKLIVISTLNRNTNPRSADIFQQDAYWLRDKFGLTDTEPRSNSRGSSNRRRSSGSKSTTGSRRTRSKSSRSKSSKSRTKTSSKTGSKSRSSGSTRSKR